MFFCFVTQARVHAEETPCIAHATTDATYHNVGFLFDSVRVRLFANPSDPCHFNPRFKTVWILGLFFKELDITVQQIAVQKNRLKEMIDANQKY